MAAEIKNLENLQNTEYSLKKLFSEAEDFLPLLGTDYVELYVGNAKQSAHFYKTAFGFQSEAYAGMETGVKDRVSYVLKQDKIRLVLTTPLQEGGPINEHINKHGDGVKVVALWVEDATKSWEETTKRGAKSFMEPTKETDEHGEVVRSGIYTYGETVHIFVERKNYHGTFLPGFRKWESHYNPTPVGFEIYRPYGGQCGMERNEPVVRILCESHGVCPNYFVRRQRYFYRLYRFDEQGNEQWEWPNQVSHQ